MSDDPVMPLSELLRRESAKINEVLNGIVGLMEPLDTYAKFYVVARLFHDYGHATMMRVVDRYSEFPDGSQQ